MLSFIMSAMFPISTHARSIRITHSFLRLILIVLIGFWAPFAQTAEPSFDVLSNLLRAYAGPIDERAAEAPPEAETPPESGARLAAIQADLSLMAEGFEAFRHPSHAQHALQDLPDYVVPELRPFFKDRDSTLDTLYRTLAVTDYTWALRFPEPTCDPRTRRKILLASKDGLFTDPKSGDLSPWLARLLGPAAYGRTAEEALDRASSKQTLSARDYELLRVKVARITEALSSDKAVGKERAKLYCLRADAYETLALAHRASEGAPIQASRATDSTNQPDKEGAAVLLIAVMEGPDRFRAVGAGVLVETVHGRKVLTDAGLLPAGGEAGSALRGFIRAKDGALDKPRVITFERTDQTTSVMVGRIEGADRIPALKISQGFVARQDLVRAIGHISAGTWTVGQGLVTDIGNGTFASDAILGPDMRGSPLLNDMGEVVGLVVLSPQGAPTAIMPERLRELTDGDGPVPVSADIQFVESRQTGSGAVLTASNPNYIYTQTPYGTVRGRCIGCNDAPQSSYSSGSSGGAEIGQALGQAMAPLVEAMIFKGIPALFRGIGSLFKSKPRTTAPAPHRGTAQDRPREIEKPKDPPKIAGIEVKLDRSTALEGEQVTATARVTFTEDYAKKDQIAISFSVDPAAKVVITDGQKGFTRFTDASGRAKITYEISATAKERERPFDALKQEERRRAGEKTISQVRPQRKAKNDYDRIKAKMEDRFRGLDDEEAKNEDADPASDQNVEPASDSLTQAALLTGPAAVKMETLYSLALKARVEPAGQPVLPGAKLDDDGKTEVQSGACPTGMVAVMSPPGPPGGSPGNPAHIDPLKAKQLLECKEIEDRILAKCADDLACEARELKQEHYFEQGCESRWRKLGGVSPGSMGIPNIQRRSGNYWCLPAKPRTSTGAQIYSQGIGGDSTKDDGDQEKKTSQPTTAELIERILGILKPDGRWIGEKIRDVIRIRGTLEDTNKLFERLTQGLKIGPHPNPKIGTSGRQATNGEVTIGLRPVSQSGPPTIDISMPGRNPIEVKFTP